MNSLKDSFMHEINLISNLIENYPFEKKDFLYSWMCQQYYIVQNSTRYLSLAASLVPVGESSEFREWVHHLNEEVDHDKGLLNDIKKLHGSSELEPMSADTKALIGALYYDIQTNGPEALLGYALMLEGLSCYQCANVSERIKKAHNVSSAYLNLHARVDQEHFPEGLEKISTYTGEKAKIVESNLKMSSRLYANFLNGLASRNSQSHSANLNAA